MNDDIQKLRELIKDIDIGMLTTVQPDGTLHSRPMSNQSSASNFDGTLWFFTDLESTKVHEVQGDSHVNVSYADATKQNYISVSGRASVVRDRAKMKELWTVFHKAWFPKGLDDPNIALLRVDVDKAEYWDAPSGKIIQMIGFAKAMLTGKPYGDEALEHKKVNL